MNTTQEISYWDLGRIRAALAREAIVQGDRVPLGWLAALAGMPVYTLRQSRGELRTLEGSTITADEAKRWLSARGVEGFR